MDVVKLIDTEIGPTVGLIELCNCVNTLKAQLLKKKPDVKNQNEYGIFDAISWLVIVFFPWKDARCLS